MEIVELWSVKTEYIAYGLLSGFSYLELHL